MGKRSLNRRRQAPMDSSETAGTPSALNLSTVQKIKAAFEWHLETFLAQHSDNSTAQGRYSGLALAVRDGRIGRWLQTRDAYGRSDAKPVCYLAVEFLRGRVLGNYLVNLGIF